MEEESGKLSRVIIGVLIVVLLAVGGVFAWSRVKASREIASLGNDKKSLSSTLASREKELNEAQTKIKELEKERTSAKSEIVKLTELNETLQGTIASYSDAIASADKRIESLTDSVDIRQKAMSNMEADIAGLKQEAGELRETLESLREENASLLEKISAVPKPEEKAREQKIDSLRVEDALPACGDAFGTFIFKMSGTGAVSAALSELSDALSSVSSLVGLDYDKDFDEFMAGLDSAKNFFGAMRDLALLIKFDSRFEIYGSFSADSQKLKEFMTKESYFCRFDEWDSVLAEGGHGYILRPTFVKDDARIYMAERPSEEGSMVFLASGEAAMSDMIDAYDGVSPRFETERNTSGETFFQTKLRDGLTYGDIGRELWRVPGLSNLWNLERGKVLYTTMEGSFTKNGDNVESESYCDLLELNPEFLQPRSEGGKVEVYGDGELAYYLSVDFGFLLNLVMPGAARQIPEVMSVIDEYIPAFLPKKDFMDLLKGGRLSFVCVEKYGRISTAYMALETNAPNIADSLYSMASALFVITYPGAWKAEMPGWESSLSAPFLVEFRTSNIQSAVIAGKRGIMIAGVGNRADFEKTIEIPAEYNEFVDPENLIGVFMSSKIIDVAINIFNDVMDFTQPDLSPRDIKIKDMLSGGMSGVRDSFRYVGGSLKRDGYAHEIIALVAGKNPIEAIFDDFITSSIKLALEDLNENQE